MPLIDSVTEHWVLYCTVYQHFNPWVLCFNGCKLSLVSLSSILKKSIFLYFLVSLEELDIYVIQCQGVRVNQATFPSLFFFFFPAQTLGSLFHGPSALFFMLFLVFSRQSRVQVSAKTLVTTKNSSLLKRLGSYRLKQKVKEAELCVLDFNVFLSRSHSFSVFSRGYTESILCFFCFLGRNHTLSQFQQNENVH